MSAVSINGRDLHFRSESGGDKGAIYQVFTRQDYALSDMAQTMPLLGWLGRQKRPPLIVDAGAHIGCATIWFKNSFPEARIIAVEPEAENFKLLAQNAMGVEGVSTVHGGIASYNGTGYCSDPGRDTWGYRVGTEQADDALAVKMRTMRWLMAMEPDAVPFIAKIDIEGGEDELFARNCAWLVDFPLTIIELHDWMLPGRASSRNFLLAVALNNFDVVMRGENLFCFNNPLLGMK